MYGLLIFADNENINQEPQDDPEVPIETVSIYYQKSNISSEVNFGIYLINAFHKHIYFKLGHRRSSSR